MYCELCGQAVSEGLFGELVHDYSTRDAHAPYVASTEFDCD